MEHSLVVKPKHILLALSFIGGTAFSGIAYPWKFVPVFFMVYPIVVVVAWVIRTTPIKFHWK